MAHRSPGVWKDPSPWWLVPGFVEVQEGEAFVIRNVLTGSMPWSRPMSPAERTQALRRLRPGRTVPLRVYQGYRVFREGVHGLYIPRMVHDPVARVSLIPSQEEVIPIPVNVEDGLQVHIDVKLMWQVGQINWNWLLIPVDQADELGFWLDEVAAFRRLSPAEQAQRGHRIQVRHPTTPFDPEEPFVVNDEAIIRVALRVKDIWAEVETALRSAVAEASLFLGINQVRPRDVVDWLNRQPNIVNPQGLPLARHGDTNRTELMQQSTVMANQTLHALGLVLYDLRIQSVILPESIRTAAERLQQAELHTEAARVRAQGTRAEMEALGMGTAPPGVGYLGHSYAAAKLLELQAAREGVQVPTASVNFGSMFAGTASTPAGGAGGKGPGRSPGGRGAPRNRR